MRRKKKRTAVKAAFIYLLMTLGSWMFVNSYANSYNRLSGDRMIPAGIAFSDRKASVKLLDYSAEFGISGIAPDSKAYCAAYLLSPDELRAAAYIISLCI